MTTKTDIKRWLENAEDGTTYMLVVCDTFDYEDYPVYTSNISNELHYYNSARMQKVMEVYDLNMDFETQLDQRRSWNV